MVTHNSKRDLPLRNDKLFFEGMKNRCEKAEKLRNSQSSTSTSNSSVIFPDQNQVEPKIIVTDFRKPKCSDFRHLDYGCVSTWKCIGGKFNPRAR